MSNNLTLAEIIRRGVAVDWPEAVALVRSVAERLSVLPSPVIPELHHIELDASGRVDVIGGISSDEPVRRLGQLLQASLGQGEPPVQLRLVISQATAPTPSFAGIREFDEVLGYYERPNRDAILRGLYERAAAAPPLLAAQASPAPTVDSIAPLPSREPVRPPKPPKTPSQKRRIRRQIAVAAILLLAIAGAVQYLRVSGATEANAELAALAEKASGVVGEAVVTGLSAVTEKVGLGRLVTEPSAAEAPKTPETAAAAPPARTPASRGSRAAADTPPAPTVPIIVYDLEPAPASASGSERPAGDADSAPPTIVLDGAGEPDVYDPTYGDVVPPVGIRPQLPRDLPRGVRIEDLARIELVITVDGSVETVKLVSSPRNIHDLMWLSAIKAWRFQPALKDGQPVRYLKTVWIAAQ